MGKYQRSWYSEM
ncbi:Protein of unknown function [Bacillus cytotoxicus]|nr:Protein of unknown function [Bacillus cytotoxicus]